MTEDSQAVTTRGCTGMADEAQYKCSTHTAGGQVCHKLTKNKTKTNLLLKKKTKNQAQTNKIRLNTSVALTLLEDRCHKLTNI